MDVLSYLCNKVIKWLLLLLLYHTGDVTGVTVLAYFMYTCITLWRFLCLAAFTEHNGGVMVYNLNHRERMWGLAWMPPWCRHSTLHMKGKMGIWSKSELISEKGFGLLCVTGSVLIGLISFSLDVFHLLPSFVLSLPWSKVPFPAKCEISCKYKICITFK